MTLEKALPSCYRGEARASRIFAVDLEPDHEFGGSPMTAYSFLTDAQLASELARCEFCTEKPCRNACPAHCSPADFIMAARQGSPSDFKRAAAEILQNNPLGGICGVVCPDFHCMKACVHREFDRPVNIPKIQATLIEHARRLEVEPRFQSCRRNGLKVAIVGAGPAGMAAAAVLAQRGYEVHVFEKSARPGGACLLIPERRLPRAVIENDFSFVQALEGVTLLTGMKVGDPEELLEQGFQAVILAVGLWRPLRLRIDNEDRCLSGLDYLSTPDTHLLRGRVLVVGGGATACDCATTAKERGASQVEMVALENWAEMPLTAHEREDLRHFGIELSGRTRLIEILMENGRLTGVRLQRVVLPEGTPFSPRAIKGLNGSEQLRRDVDHIIIAIGGSSGLTCEASPPIFLAGDCDGGPSTVVEAVAAGKNSAHEVDQWLARKGRASFTKKVKSTIQVSGYGMTPVPLRTDFFGRPLRTPFLLSASPISDGLDQMVSAYEAGWAGGVLKTSFDGLPIHIPGEYMHVFDENTYGNCDNVSGHPLDRVCDEIGHLVRMYPDRLTIGSTGGPVTGRDEADRAVWQANTRKLEQAGAMAIEYSLSCPQGGDGTEGDIVSQNAALTAKIIDWILSAGSAEVPKLFKLTGAVTSIAAIVLAVRQVLEHHPGKPAGITLANSFPSLCFRPGAKPSWDEGIVVGMSGEGVLPISYLTLATAAPLGVHISGNGGPMHYKAAADFLALGVRTVQFCTLVTKYGYAIHDELCSGVSHLMEARGIGSMKELIGCALPSPITGFMELSPAKKLSACRTELCQHCGNCTRCPYQAISLNEQLLPVTDPAKCIGCGICAKKCFSGALYLRERTPEEQAVLREA